MTAPTELRLEGALRIEGLVEHGDERGRLLGFPTANIGAGSHEIGDGVWAGLAELDTGHLLVAAVSIGHRPTYYGRDGERLLEANLLDFSGDLYGRRLVVHLCTRLRPQRRFADSEALVRQLRADVTSVRTWAEREGFDHLLG